MIEAARLRGEPVEEIERLALYYALCDESLTPRQLRDLAVAAVQNLRCGRGQAEIRRHLLPRR